MDRFRNTRPPDWGWWSKLWPTPGETLRRLGFSGGASLVEIGCGSGYFALPAARIIDPAPVYAVDVDASLLEELVRLADLQEIANVVPVHGDARSLTRYLPESVDVALIANTFHGIEEPAEFVKQVFDSVVAGGELIVINWDDRPREATRIDGRPRGPPTGLRLSADETRVIVETAADFALTRCIDLPPYHYALIFER